MYERCRGRTIEDVLDARRESGANIEAVTSPESFPPAGYVTVAAADGVATVEFAHPKGNSLPGSLLRTLARDIREAGARADVGVVLLRSGGNGPFCAGASFDELAAIRDSKSGKEFFLGFARVILAMIRCPKPIVTRVQGKVVGGGVGLVAASDYVMASHAAQLRLSELAVGIGPFVVGPAIERKIGAAVFSAMALDADWRSPHWAAEHGLYSQVFESVGALDAALEVFVARLARANPAATTQLKRVLWEGTDDWERLLDERAEMSGTLVLSEQARRAIDEARKR
jgi:methylglutaconyl-CoA hydratase